MLAALMGLAAGAAGVAAIDRAPAPSTERTRIEAIVRDYILDHPEILPEAMERLQSRETAKAVAANRRQIEMPFARAWEGAADGDVTLVQFFDYNCGYCRASLPDIDRLLAEDRRLKIVYREFPVLGDASVAAARIGLVAATGPDYARVHRALYTARDARGVERVARQFGVDARLAGDPAIEREIAANRGLAQPLRLTGTPSWVIDGKVLSGAVGYAALKDAITEARKGR